MIVIICKLVIFCLFFFYYDSLLEFLILVLIKVLGFKFVLGFGLWYDVIGGKNWVKCKFRELIFVVKD